jgi:hypothetical protein
MTDVLRQNYDPTRPAFIRQGQDATKVSCPNCAQIHWIGDCGERCDWRSTQNYYRPDKACNLPEHEHVGDNPHFFSRPICTCLIGSGAGREMCPRHYTRKVLG